MGYLGTLKETGLVENEDEVESVETQISHSSNLYVNGSYSSKSNFISQLKC